MKRPIQISGDASMMGRVGGEILATLDGKTQNKKKVYDFNLAIMSNDCHFHFEIYTVLPFPDTNEFSKRDLGKTEIFEREKIRRGF